MQNFRSILKAAWRFFGRCFVMAGLPIIAWGFSDLAGFLSNPARAGFLAVVAAQALGLAWLGEMIPPKAEPTREWRTLLGHYHADLIEFLYILIAYNDRRSLLTLPDSLPLRSAGLAVFLAGALVSLSASFTWVRHLQTEPSTADDSPVLLTQGLYRWIRYPKMLALLLECLGVSLIFRSWAGLVFLLPVFASIVNQIHVMERVFSEQYRRAWYARVQTSKKFLPFVY